jgi:hypothetical protein
MDIQEAIAKAQDAITVNRVYGEPYERDGVVFIPAAEVRGGGGGGGGSDASKEASGSGGGYGINARIRGRLRDRGRACPVGAPGRRHGNRCARNGHRPRARIPPAPTVRLTRRADALQPPQRAYDRRPGRLETGPLLMPCRHASAVAPERERRRGAVRRPVRTNPSVGRRGIGAPPVAAAPVDDQQRARALAARPA